MGNHDDGDAKVAVDLTQQFQHLVCGGGVERGGGFVEVHYVGVSYEDNQEFDSSWGRGQSLEVPLTGLIAGWQEGIPG